MRLIGSKETDSSPTLNKEKSSSDDTPRKGIRWFRQAPTFSGNTPTSTKPKRLFTSRAKEEVKPEQAKNPDHKVLIEQLRDELGAAQAAIKRLEEKVSLEENPSQTLHAVSDDEGSPAKVLFVEEEQSDHQELVPPLTATVLTSPVDPTAEDSTPPTTLAEEHVSLDDFKKDTDASAKGEVVEEDIPEIWKDATNLNETVSANRQTPTFENTPMDVQDLNSLTDLSPPAEVLTIREQAIPSECEEKDMPLRLKDAEQRAEAYRNKLEKADDLVASLFTDLERAKRSMHTLTTRNLALTSKLKGFEIDQEDNMIHRSSLFKACMFICPVFVLFGGLEVFISTIILVWATVEIESAMALYDKNDDGSVEEEVERLQQWELLQEIKEDSTKPKIL